MTGPGTLGTNVRRRREEADLSREQLAVAAGIAAKTVFRIEVGGDKPTLTVIEALAVVLKCTPADLLTPDAQSPEPGDRDPETKAS